MGAAKLEGAIFEVDSDTGRCRDVQLVRDTFKRRLASIYHSRVTYPELKKS